MIRNRLNTTTLVTAILTVGAFFLCLGTANPILASKLNWTDWQRMPVFDGGRLMPVDTFARSAVETICGRENPKLSLDGKPRKFSAAELLFGWLVEPETWERTPFLTAAHEELRIELLGLPIVGPNGGRLKYASPMQVENAHKFRVRLAELAERQRRAKVNGEKFVPTGVDKKVKQLYDAYTLYRLITFNPKSADANRRHFFDHLANTAHSWTKLKRNLAPLTRLDSSSTAYTGLAVELERMSRSMQELATLSGKRGAALEDLERSAVAFRTSSAKLASQFAGYRAEFKKSSPDRIQKTINVLAFDTANLSKRATEMHLALYTNGHSLPLVPALNPYALDADRSTTDDTSPWLDLQSVTLGSDSLLRNYPKSELEQVRKTFKDVTSAYTDRTSPDRAANFSKSMSAFTSAVRSLGNAIEPLRLKLPIAHRDNALLTATAYPPVGYANAEVDYNQNDPFFWAWIVNLVALIFFAMSFGIIRKPMFWLGLATLAIGQCTIIYGFAIRSYITGWAPVANMFETVVFVALVVSFLGLWFTLLPMTWPGLRRAWRLTSAPWLVGQGKGGLLHWSLFSIRIGLSAFVFYYMAVAPCGSGNRAIVNLLPNVDIGSTIPTTNTLLTWLIGLCVLIPTVWFVPRLIMTTLLSIVTVPIALAYQGFAQPVSEVFKRKPFGIVGAAVAFLVAYTAYYAPVLNKDLEPLMPVLRDNFWLTMHVLTITAAYGAGALAWGLGNIALAYFLFGRYHNGPPTACSTLAGFNYRATQIAVVLLAIGTILGGLWADVSWGRFWGWDPKEVWALITLLVYIAILHGRYAGWFGSFGMAVGSVLGASAIMMAWYGVNHILGSGLHTYGHGAGGQLQVGTVVLCNWLFLTAAAVRYAIERGKA